MKRVVDPITGEWFQHTAARRRLQHRITKINKNAPVSTHSRAEAAAATFQQFFDGKNGFNTQPRGGGCAENTILNAKSIRFQHTAARRRLHRDVEYLADFLKFQHTAARRRLRSKMD